MLGIPQLPAAVPDVTLNGVFLGVMVEMGEEIPAASSAATPAATSAGTWTLLNPSVAQNASTHESQSDPALLEKSLEKKDAADWLTFFSAPTNAPPPVPVPPLALNLGLSAGPRIDLSSGETASPKGSGSGLVQALTEGKQSTEGATATAGGSAPAADDLAFAVKISHPDKPVRPVETGDSSPSKQEPEIAIEPAETSELGLELNAETKTPEWNAGLPVAPATKQQQPVEGPAKAAPVEAPAPIQEVETRPAEAVREVAIAIEGAEGRVRLRMETHSGELRAWVTGSNTDTVERVRAELPDLARSLKETGFKSELWAPSSIKQVGTASELHTASEHGQRDFVPDHQQDDGSRRRRPQPAWLEEEE